MIFKTLTDIYIEKVIEGEIHDVLLKKNVVSRKYIEPTEIATVNEVMNKRGRIYKSQCMITLKDGTPVLLKHKFDEIVKLKQPYRVNGYGGK